MAKIKIKPCKGFRVKKPNGDFLKDSGEFVEQGTYWRRRIQFKEVELVGGAEPKAESAPVEKKPEVKKEEKKEEVKKEESKKDSKAKGSK